jgi:hypothetical protein
MYHLQFTGATEEYDGSTWTTVSSLSTARYGLGGSKAGANKHQH